MNKALVGRGIAAVGVVLGFVAIWLDYISAGGSSSAYSDDGTVLAFLLITLIPAAILVGASLTGREDLDAAAAVVGSAAFGFYLFIPSAFGFNHFEFISTGGWLGVCAGLIPLGMWYSLSSRSTTVARPGPDVAAPAILGRILCLIAIWLTADSGASYWNLLDQGRALPALMLLLLIGGAALGVATTFGSATRVTADGALILAAVTFGLYEALLIGDAFDEFGRLDTGSWLGSVGALILLIGVVRVWKAATGGTTAARAAPAAAATPPAA
jgi:hypothetical protein